MTWQHREGKGQCHLSASMPAGQRGALEPRLGLWTKTVSALHAALLVTVHVTLAKYFHPLSQFPLLQSEDDKIAFRAMLRVSRNATYKHRVSP